MSTKHSSRKKKKPSHRRTAKLAASAATGQAKNNSPKSAYATQLSKQGLSKIHQGLHDDGIQQIQSALEGCAAEQELLTDYRDLLLILKKEDKAVEITQKILAIDPGNASEIEHLCNYYFVRRELYRGYRALCKGIQVNPNALILHALKARAYMLCERYDDALATLNQYFSTTKYQSIIEMIAECYYRTGRADIGLAVLKNEIANNPTPKFMERAAQQMLLHGQLVDVEIISKKIQASTTSPKALDKAKELSIQLCYLHIADKYQAFVPPKNPSGRYDIAVIGYNSLLENGGGHQPPQIARCLANQGHRILYANPFEFTTGPRENFSIFDDPFVNSWFRPASQYIKDRYSAAINNAFPDTGSPRERILLVAGPSLYINSLIPHFKSHGFKVVYWCIDDFQGINSVMAPHAIEKWLSRQIDAALATVQSLADKIESYSGKRPKVISNGFSTKNFPLDCPTVDKPEDMITGEKTFVYWGGIGMPWISWEFMLSVVQAHPEWAFNFIGPKPRLEKELTPALTEIMTQPNVAFVGRKMVDTLYPYACHSDIALIHFNEHLAAKSTSHVKLYEYLAAGLPVIALPCEHLNGIPSVTQVKSIEEFEATVERLSHTPPSREEVLAFLSDKSWDARARGFIEHLDAVF